MSNMPLIVKPTNEVQGQQLKICLSKIVCLAAEGRCTLQVPQLWLDLQDDASFLSKGEQPLLVDSDCFVNLNDCLPSKNGFLYLTRKGFEKFRDELEKAFSTQRGFTWNDFCEHAENHFKKVDAKIKKKIKRLETELQTLSNFKS